MLGAKPVISGNPSVGPQVACLRRDLEFSRFFACVRKHTVVYREARSNYRRLKVQYFFAGQGWGAGREPTPLPGSTRLGAPCRRHMRAFGREGSGDREAIDRPSATSRS